MASTPRAHIRTSTPARKNDRRTGGARAGKPTMPRIGEEMWALVYDAERDRWDKTRGFRREKVAKPQLDPKDPLDASAVILKVKFTGFCGSDAGIWFRSSFKNMIHDSLKAEGKTTRVIGHEVFAEVAEVGAVAAAHYGLKKGELVAAESHIVCGRCHQCLIGQRHVCTDERIIGIIGLAAILIVIFVTRTGLAIHRRVIEIVHLVGARDSYIARQLLPRHAGNLAPARPVRAAGRA
ncbi:MAG: alcohol dehydrogenase catalytic domain-containing protein, partial [Candidatus Latescibacteria bacterium]|nr:alcohol dehydrogenase catalytic domain-containing protein [Candidatus Latescibacterota bacterium]